MSKGADGRRPSCLTCEPHAAKDVVPRPGHGAAVLPMLSVPFAGGCPGVRFGRGSACGSRMEGRWARRVAAGRCRSPSCGHRRRKPAPSPQATPLRWFDRKRLPSCCGRWPVDGGPGHAEQVAEFGGAVLTAVQQLDQVRFLPRVELGLLAPHLNSSRPTGSVGSYTDAPRLSRTLRLVRSSAIAPRRATTGPVGRAW